MLYQINKRPTTFDLNDPKHYWYHNSNATPEDLHLFEQEYQGSFEAIQQITKEIKEDEYSLEPFCYDLDGLKEQTDTPKFVFEMDQDFVDPLISQREKILKKIRGSFQYDPRQTTGIKEPFKGLDLLGWVTC